MKAEEEWDVIIEPKTKLFSINLQEVWHYRDLMMLLVRRDFVAEYKQTILGPIWYLIQPIFTAVTYFFVLNKMGGMPTEGIPPILFHLSGLTIWTYFSTCLLKVSDTFISNANIFGKVYFPRVIVPISIVTSNLIKLALQFGLLSFFITYFHFTQSSYKFTLSPNFLLLPFPVILSACLSLGLGLIISSITSKYRDLRFALSFGVQLLMYGSSVIISFESIPLEYRNILKWNPVANIVELFRTIILNSNQILWPQVIYSSLFTFFIIIIGLILFSRTEKNFMDTV